jgi:hypothetical protein
MQWKRVVIHKTDYDEIQKFRMTLGFHSVSDFVQEATRRYIRWAYRETGY